MIYIERNAIKAFSTYNPSKWKILTSASDIMKKNNKFKYTYQFMFKEKYIISHEYRDLDLKDTYVLIK